MTIFIRIWFKDYLFTSFIYLKLNYRYKLCYGDSLMQRNTKNSRVSIIVPTYNCEKYIAECLDSILNQTYPEIEAIIVYDPSRDNTLEILKSYYNKFPDRIKLIIQDKKTSPAIARNVGLMHATGHFVGFCDADDFFKKKKIELEVEYLNKYSDVGLVYTDAIFVNQKSRIIGELITPEWNFEYWLRNRFIAFSSILTYTKLARRVGGFNTSLDAFDDFDFLLRLSKVTKFMRVPYVLTAYRQHFTNLSKQRFKSLKNIVKIFFINRLYSLVFLDAHKYLPSWIIDFPIVTMLKKTMPIRHFMASKIKPKHS